MPKSMTHKLRKSLTGNKHQYWKYKLSGCSWRYETDSTEVSFSGTDSWWSSSSGVETYECFFCKKNFKFTEQWAPYNYDDAIGPCCKRFIALI